MIDILLASLIEYINTKTEHVRGGVEAEHVVESKKRFAAALNEFVDNRVAAHLEERRRTQSQERISIADSINSAMKSTAVSVKSIAALNSAPSPPPDPEDKDAFDKWVKNYDEWYQCNRKKGMQIG